MQDGAQGEAQSESETAGLRELYAVRKQLTPSMATFQGAIMVADVTGFTKLTEILSSQGKGGVELLTKCMNNVFSQVRRGRRAARRDGTHAQPRLVR